MAAVVRVLRPFLSQSFIVRYVDNRFIVTSREFADSLAIRTLVSPLFYGAPIELEDVGDDHFFGTSCSY